jgi:hypothetical protein
VASRRGSLLECCSSGIAALEDSSRRLDAITGLNIEKAIVRWRIRAPGQPGLAMDPHQDERLRVQDRETIFARTEQAEMRNWFST